MRFVCTLHTSPVSIAFSGDNSELQCTFAWHVNSALIETPMNSKAFLIKLRGADAWLCDEFIRGGQTRHEAVLITASLGI